MSLPITLVLDLEEYVRDYDINIDRLTDDIFKKVKEEIGYIVKQQIKEDDIRDKVNEEILRLDFQVALKEFLKENKDEVIERIARLLERKEEIYKHIYQLKQNHIIK